MSERERSLVTFALFAYNQEKSIREAVEGALQQDYSPLEVILSDDFSTDRTYEIMQEMAANYSGPHRVILNRNARNLGIGGHVNRVMELARGELVVVAAGDDISLSIRTTILADYSRQYPSAFLFYSNMAVIDNDGQDQGCWARLGEPETPPDLSEVVTKGRGVFGCTQAFHRDLFKLFGPINSSIVAEDTIIPFRALLLGNINYIDIVLVKYRRHQENISKGRERMTSLDVWRNYSKLFVESEIAVIVTMKADLAKLGELDAEKHNLLSWISAAIDKRELALEIERDILSTSSQLKKLKLISFGIFNRVKFRRCIRWVLWQLWPKKYHD